MQNNAPKVHSRGVCGLRLLFHPQVKCDKGTSAITLVPLGKTHTHAHTQNTNMPYTAIKNSVSSFSKVISLVCLFVSLKS